MEFDKILRDRLLTSFKADVFVEVSDEAINQVIDAAQYREYKKKTVLVEQGVANGDLFITLNGVTRIAYFDGTKEITFGFGGEGSIFLSPLGYTRLMPAHFSLITTTDCMMLVLPRQKLQDMTRQNLEIAYWLFNLSLSQMANLEFKMSNNKMTAKDRYRDMMHRKDMELYKQNKFRRVRILDVVSDKVLASYLGVIPTHLSNIKNEIIREEREKNSSKEEEAAQD